VKHFQSTDSAYAENLQDSTLANFIIFWLRATFYAQHLCILMCVCTKFNMPNSNSEFVTAIRTEAKKEIYTIFTKY